MSLRAQLFPLESGSNTVFGNIGFIAGFFRSFFLQSSLATVAINTTATSYYGGIRARIPVGGETGPILGISLSYAGQAFGFDATANDCGGACVDLPDVSYTAVRPAADARIPFGKVSLLAEAGFRAVIEAGQDAARFLSPTPSGVGAQGRAALLLVPGLGSPGVGGLQHRF